MTDDQLHHLWHRGISVEQIAKQACLSRSSIRSRIKRLRAKDPTAWPTRDATIHPKGSGRPKYQKKRAPRLTLAPLESLKSVSSE